MDNGFLTSSPRMLSFVHLGLQIFVGLLIARIVHCRGENIPIGVLRRMHHLIAAAFQTCCCYMLGKRIRGCNLFGIRMAFKQVHCCLCCSSSNGGGGGLMISMFVLLLKFVALGGCANG